MANKLGSKILDFLRFDNEEEFDDDFYEDDIDEFSERELQREARREEKERKKNAKHTSTFREENDAYFNDKAAAPKARTGTATRSSGSKVVRMPSSNSELEVCIVKPSNIGEAQQVCDTLLNDHPVVVNLEGIDLMEAQRIMDFISGCIFAISGNMCQVSRFIFIFSPNGVEISGDYIKSLETEESYNIASFNKEF